MLDIRLNINELEWNLRFFRSRKDADAWFALNCDYSLFKKTDDYLNAFYLFVDKLIEDLKIKVRIISEEIERRKEQYEIKAKKDLFLKDALCIIDCNSIKYNAHKYLIDQETTVSEDNLCKIAFLFSDYVVETITSSIENRLLHYLEPFRNVQWTYNGIDLTTDISRINSEQNNLKTKPKSVLFEEYKAEKETSTCNQNQQKNAVCFDKKQNKEDSKKDKEEKLYLNSCYDADNNRSCDYLFSIMDIECKKAAFYSYSSYLWHATDIRNIVAILKDGKMLSRQMLGKKIPFDMKSRNETTGNVLSTDECAIRLRQYVRLYINPCNGVPYSFSKVPNAVVALLKIDRNIIKDSEYPTLMSKESAHFMEKEDFDWRYSLNRKHRIIMPKTNFYETYSEYKKGGDNKHQRAEVLVYKEIDVRWIKEICFQKKEHLIMFEQLLRNEKCSTNIPLKYDPTPFYGNLF